jgi:hypothetical protein
MERPVKAMPCKEQLAASGRCAAAALLPAGRFPPYLVLLRVGFTLPPALPTERCALTAPFHPYPGGTGRPGEPEEPFRKPSAIRRSTRGSRGGIFSVALAVHGSSGPRPGRYPAHCPAEFGLSSPGEPRLREEAGSDRPVLLPVGSLAQLRVYQLR